MIDYNEFDEVWKPSAVSPQRVVLSDEQKELVLKDLHSLGVTDDIFKMDGLQRLEFLNRTVWNAQVVYAALIHATQGTHKITQDFRSWSKGLGLKW